MRGPIALLIALALAAPAAAQDWDAMIRQQLQLQDQMVRRQQAAVDTLIRQRMHDPDVQAAWRQHQAAAAARGQPAQDLYTFTYHFIATRGFTPDGTADFRRSEAENQRREYEAWQRLRDAEDQRRAAIGGLNDGFSRNQQEAGRQLRGESTYQTPYGPQVLPHTWPPNSRHVHEGRHYGVDPAGNYWVWTERGQWEPVTR